MPTELHANDRMIHQNRLRRAQGKSTIRAGFALNVVWLIAASLFFVPKVTLFEVANSRAGLRIDDFIIALTLPILVYNCRPVLKLSAGVVGGFCIWFIASMFGLIVGHGSIFFVLRNLEYLAFLVIGMYFTSRRSIYGFLSIYVAVNAVVMIGQQLGYVGGVAIEGYRPIEPWRVIGLCNGPWEMGLVFAIACGYLLHRGCRSRPGLGCVLVAICTPVLLLTSARTPIAIWAVVVVLYYLKCVKDNSVSMVTVAAAITGMLCVGVMIFVYLPPDSLAIRRLNEFFNTGTWNSLVEYVRTWRPDIAYVAAGTDNDLYTGAGLDASLAQRFYIFTYVFSNYYYGGPFIWFFGLGAGHFGPSTDIGWLRVLSETGMIGLAAFIYYGARIWRAVPGSRMMIACIAINMLTLDAYQGYKIMAVFYLVCGAEIVLQRLDWCGRHSLATSRTAMTGA